METGAELKVEIDYSKGLVTEKQGSVLGEVAVGNQKKQIARNMGVSYSAVDKQVSHLLKRFDAKNIAELVLKAVHYGVLKVPVACLALILSHLPSWASFLESAALRVCMALLVVAVQLVPAKPAIFQDQQKSAQAEAPINNPLNEVDPEFIARRGRRDQRNKNQRTRRREEATC